MTLRSVFALALALSTGRAAAQSSFVNWESPPVHPVDVTPDGTTLLVTNTADDRLEVFTLGGTLPVHAASIPVGLDPVAVRVRTNGEAWVVNRVSDSVSIVDLATQNVRATLHVGDEPADVVFAGSPVRAFVSVSQENRLAIYDPTNLGAAPTSLPIAGNSPRALATDGTRVFVAIFDSGNRSMILPRALVDSASGPYGGVNPPPNSGGVGGTFTPPIAGGLPTPPPTSLIINKEGTNWKDDNNQIWDALVTWNLNENDVAVVQTGTLVTTYAKNILNIDMAIAYNPVVGRVTVIGSYGPNEHRFEVNARNQFARWRIGFFDPSAIPAAIPALDINQHLLANPPMQPYKTSVTPAEHHLCAADPRGMVWQADGSGVWVAAMGSNNVVKMQENGTRLATVDVGQGPTGLAIDTPRSRLYVLNRFDGTVSSVDIGAAVEVGRVSFYDPTPAVIRYGRPFLYDAHRTSKLGNVSCAGCHVDATMDTEAWDLGDPQGAMKVLDEPCNQGIGLGGACNDWHPMKGPMMTQSLIGSVGTEPLHWRGDREDMNAFQAGFVGLLDAAAPTTPEMDDLEAFLATIRFQPNPFRTFDDQTPASVPGFPGNAQNGETLFMTAQLDAGTTTCVTCHSGPTGARATLVSPSALGDSQAMNVPQLSGIYKKLGLSFASTTNNRGFGFGHDGSSDSVFTLLQSSRFMFPAGPTGDQQRRDLEAYVMAFRTDTHPAVGTQLTVDATNKSAPGTISQLGAMTALVDSGVVGLVAKGVVGGLARGWSYRAGTDGFQADRLAETVSTSALLQLATSGGEITFTVVPTPTAVRIGLDRDEDGYYDRDEIDAGSDPADPNSIPPGGAADTDGDGVVDASDDCPNVANADQGDGDGDGVGDACDLCTGPAPIAPGRLILGRLTGAAGDETLKVVGLVTVPATPALDPAANGLRLLVHEADGTTILDQAVAGGSGWTANAKHTLWKYTAPTATGVTKVRLRAGKTPGSLKVQVQAKRLTLPPLANLPLQAMVVFDLPYATTGQCGVTGAGTCATNASGSTMRCR